MLKSWKHLLAVSFAGVLTVLFAGGRVVIADDTDNTRPEAKAPTLNTTETSLGKAGEELVEYSERFSSDWRHAAWVVKHGEKEAVVVDGVKGKEYDSIGKGSLIFSPDSKHVAYEARRNGKCVVVLDGVESKEYDNIFTPIFSPDGNRVLYMAKRGEKRLIIVDGVEGREYDNIWLYNPIFIPDSERVAYVAMRGEKCVVVVDGAESKEYDEFLGVVPDSLRELHGLARRDGEIFLVEIEITE